MKYKVTIIIPALDEESNLPSCVDQVLDSLARSNVTGELIIVNDGSTDRTGELAEEFRGRFPFIQVIHHDTSHGIGASFWEGVQKAEGEIVVMIPGDGENDATAILRYLPVMEHVDMVVPFVLNPEVRNRLRRLLSYVYRRIINMVFRVPVLNVTGTVMYRKCILDDISLKSSGFFYQTELLIKTVRKGYLYAEKPYRLKKREAGYSKSISLSSLKNVMQSFLTTVVDVYFSGQRSRTLDPGSATAERMKERG